MLRALRRRLALLLALLSALVLTLVAAAGLWLSWQQQTRASDLVFRSRFAALCDQLAVADLVTDGWLAARQLELGGVLDLTDGGRPVHFSVRQRQDADLAALLDQAEGAALAAGLDPDAPAGEEPRQVDYTVTEPGGTRWRGLTAVLPRGGGALRLTALQPLALTGPGWQLTLLAYGGLWLAGLAVVNACYFLIRSNTIAAFTGVGILLLVSQIFQLLGLLIHPVFEVIRQFMPNVMVDALANMAFQWNYVGLCWLSGLVWFAAATAIGLLAFRRKEIR